MKTKLAILFFGLLLLCSIPHVYAAEQINSAAGKTNSAASEASVTPAGATSEVSSQKSNTGEIIVYYFYTTARCPSCHKIETYTKDAIHNTFADELKSGRMVWKMLNTDEAANEHFLADYKLITKSVVLANAKTGTWKNLDKVWELLGNKDEFEKYIIEETRAFSKEINKGK